MNNLEKRIDRHLKKKKIKRWHIDYLTTRKDVKVEKVFYKESEKKEECKIVKYISKYGIPVINFGSSDCKCKSHLFRIDNVDEIDWSNWRQFDE